MAWHDGTTHLLLTAHELLQRLVALIPRPEKNLVVYDGVLASNAKWRKRVSLQPPLSASASLGRLPAPGRIRYLTSAAPGTGVCVAYASTCRIYGLAIAPKPVIGKFLNPSFSAGEPSFTE